MEKIHSENVSVTHEKSVVGLPYGWSVDDNSTFNTRRLTLRLQNKDSDTVAVNTNYTTTKVQKFSLY